MNLFGISLVVYCMNNQQIIDEEEIDHLPEFTD